MILTPAITLKGHGGLVRSISYFPDSKQMISGSEDKAVRRWDLQAVKEIEKGRRVCEYQVKAVAASGNSRWVVTAGGDRLHGELKAWEVETGIVKTFHGHSREVSCINISADDMLLASGSEDRTAQIWSLDTGKLVAGPFKSADRVINSLALSSDGTLIASASEDSTIKLWTFESRQLLASFDGINTNIVVFSPDTQQLAYTAQIKAKDIKLTPVITLEGHKDNHVRSISYPPDGKQMISVSGDNAVETGIVKTFHGHSRFVSCIDISADGMLFASGSKYQTQIWSLDTGKPAADPTDWVGAILFAPDSKKLAVNSWGADWLEVWDIQIQKLNRGVRGKSWWDITYTPVFWTNEGTVFWSTSRINLPRYCMSSTRRHSRLSELPSNATPTGYVRGLALSSDFTSNRLRREGYSLACFQTRYRTGRIKC
ncbi:WD40 repeat-like protein [Rhizopogon vinicolor AM-OR11-026]|uniref:WD40 repeat-like protein n=1 Tax=Rhizopogon vinicolor AM-OR11-026 TaxID=1314800 RepID=A0A1B7MJB3_9AGAM|nr:WD40 repeat-like protein [Rhizopogon vinicolor AM-OR11-026]